MSQLNLRTVLSGDNISAVVEKINYNFQQIVLNGGGPQGRRGFIGPPSLPGPEGPTGGFGPTGPTGTRTYVGLTAPNTISNIQPPPRTGDIYIETDSINDIIIFWEYDGVSWSIVSSLNLSDGLFTTAEQFAGGDQTVTAVYPRVNKASNLLIVDAAAAGIEDQIFQTPLSTRKIASWLDQSYVSWGSIFANTQNQIRLLNTDPDVTGPSAGPSGTNTRLNGGGGILFSLEKLAGPTDQQIMRITNGDIAQSANNKFFSLGLSDLGGTVSLFTDELNRLAVYTTGDPNAPNNTILTDSLSVFGSEIIYSPDHAKLRVDVDSNQPTSSSIFLSKGKFNSEPNLSEWEFRLGNTGNFSDRAFRLLATDLGTNLTMITAKIASIDDRSAYTTKIAIGGDTEAIAEVEIGAHKSGRIGLGQISPALGNSFAAGYHSMNAFRDRGSSASAVWTLRGDGTRNGGNINWGSSDGKTLSFLLMPSTGSSTRTLTGDSFLSTESSITMKRTSGSFAKMFIDSYAYTQLSDTIVENAPHLVLGLSNATPVAFNFGNVSKGIGLHGTQSSIEWLTGQNSVNAKGFRVIPGAITIGGTAASTLVTQYRSYSDSNWKNAITIITEDFASGGTYSGNIIIGATPSLNIGSAKLTVVGAAGPTNSSLGGPNIVDFATTGGTSMFSLDRNGNVVAGLKFGNILYDSTDKYTLDHYEEGSWTPTLLPHGGTAIAGWNSSLYQVRKSNYTRVGNKVHVDYAIKINSTLFPNYVGQTGAMYISGLPYKPDFENVTGATVGDSAIPQYPVVPLKSSGFSRSSSSDAAAGTIKPWPGSSSTIPEGWTACNGSAYNTSTYPDLHSVLSTAGFNGIVPDLRGYFIRGFDDGAGIDVGRILGSIQQDAFKSHSHGIKYFAKGAGDGNNVLGWQTNTFGPVTNLIQPTGDVETRSKNVALNYIIALGKSTVTTGMNSGEMAGGFILHEGTKTRLYLYTYPPSALQNLSRLNINDLPVGTDSYLFGSFEYFISSGSSSPIVTGVPQSYNIGSTTFGFSINNMISSDTPLTLVTVTGQPAWMQYNSGTGFMEFAPGYTQTIGPVTTYPLTITAYNSGTPLVPGIGTCNVSITTQLAPVVSGSASATSTFGQALSVGYTASQGPITTWKAFWWRLGATVTITDPTVTLSVAGSSASLSFSSTYCNPVNVSNPNEDYKIIATNAAGSGEIITNVFMSAPGGTPLYWLANAPYYYGGGTWNIDVYDQAVGGNLVANASYYMGNYASASSTFAIYFALSISTTYYVKATLYPTGSVIDSGYSEVDEGGSYQYFTSFTNPPPVYNTPSRLPFVYNGSNTIHINMQEI